MISQPSGDSVLIIGKRNHIHRFPHFRYRVGYRNTHAAKPQHFNIIQVIAKGNGVF
jgi:hypothetical protein